MRDSNFSETCPYCRHAFPDLYQRFIDADYSTEFSVNCPRCDETIDVHVHQMPEFELSKTMTPEEYAAFVKDLRGKIK